MIHTCIGYAQMACSEDVYQQLKGSKLLISATLHPMEATMAYSAPRRKYGKVVSSGHQCMRTPETSSRGAESAKCKVASLLVMRCPSTSIFKSNCLMFGALTSWDHSQNQSIVSTSWSLSTTCQSGLKHYHADLPMPSMPARCFMRSSSHISGLQEW